MKTYPIMLRLTGKLAVVVGAGPVGRRKAAGLAEAGACVRLIAGDPAEEAAARAEVPPAIVVLPDRYDPSQLEGAAIVFACTDDTALNTHIAEDARAAGALANAVDQPADCDFFCPAVTGDGEVIVAVGTGGAAPGLAGWVRDRLAAALPAEVGAFAEALAQLRAELPEGPGRMANFKRISSRTGHEVFRRSGIGGLRELLREQGADE